MAPLKLQGGYRIHIWDLTAQTGRSRQVKQVNRPFQGG